MGNLLMNAKIKLRIIRNQLVEKKQYRKWLKTGKPVPPPHLVKQNLIKKFKDKHKTNILIETGTYLGEMVFAQKSNFKTIYSIEIQPFLYEAAKKRFLKNEHINILQGDSGQVLHSLMPTISESALIWLDGHYSGGITGKSDLNCPIYNELDAIFNNNINHTVLIDDAICFDGTNDYPAYDDLKKFINKYGYNINIINNAIIAEKK